MSQIKKLIIAISLATSTLCAGEISVWGHAGISGQWNLNDGGASRNYAGVSASIGFDAIFSNGISFGLGGWGAYTIYKQRCINSSDINCSNTTNPYNAYGIISDAYLAYSNSIFQIVAGRYDTTNLKYEWFNGHNEGLSAGVNILDFMRLWGLYSFEQALQFRKVHRESYGEMNALWNYKRHESNVDFKRDEHLLAFGADFIFGNYFKVAPYAYFVTNNFGATGFVANMVFGNSNEFYSNSKFEYTFLDTFAGSSLPGQLIWLDQEFGYDWLSFGVGYYKTFNNGVQKLTYYGDTTRFYGSVIEASEYNASGEYFGANQSTWYLFASARYDKFKFDLLYADGGYKELTALASITLFNHFEFGGGYVDLRNIGKNKRNYLVGFLKAIW